MRSRRGEETMPEPWSRRRVEREGASTQRQRSKVLAPVVAGLAVAWLTVAPASVSAAGPGPGPEGTAGSPGGVGAQERGASGAVVEAARLYRLELWVPVPPGVAFEAWTVAEQLVEWFPDWVEMTVAVGEGYEMGWEGYDAVWRGEYLEVEPPALLAFTWIPPEAVFPAGAYPTTVRLTFDEEEGGTRITLEHSGFRAGPEMDPTLDAWRAYLFNLRAFLLQSAGGVRRPGS